MAGRAYRNFLSALIVWVMLVGIQGHPSERLEDKRSSDRNVSTPKAVTPNRREPQLSETRVRESPAVDYQPLAKLSGGNTRQNPESDAKFVFPTDVPDVVSRNYEPPPEARCPDATFCEHPPHYPSGFIKNAIKSREDLKYLATVDTGPEIAQRFGADNDEPLCVYEERVMFPRAGQNQNNEWRYIVNEDMFSQGVKIQRCINATEPCKLVDKFSEGYKTSCEQKSIYRQLVAVSPDGNVAPDMFPIPASCCCHVYKFMGLTSRLGAAVDVGSTNSQSPIPRTTVSRAGRREKK